MTTITFRVTEDEARLIRSRARNQRVSVSEYLRRCATIVSAAAKPQRIRCARTGAMIFGPLKGAPPLTTESVRDMLADFP